MGEHLGRLQLQMCVGLNCGAQLPHGCGGGQVVADDVADDEGCTQ